MTAKEYLNQIKILNKRIEQRERERDSLISEAMCNSSPTLSLDKVQSSISGDPMGDKVVEIADIMHEIGQLIIEMQLARHRIIGEIHTLNNAKHIELLYLHYVECRKLTEIADIMRKSNGEPYSYDHIASMHGQALQEFDKIILKSHSNPK